MGIVLQTVILMELVLPLFKLSNLFKQLLLVGSAHIKCLAGAHHYLATFDKGKAIALYHTKRLASPGQRIVLHAYEHLGDALLGCALG